MNQMQGFEQKTDEEIQLNLLFQYKKKTVEIFSISFLENRQNLNLMNVLAKNAQNYWFISGEFKILNDLISF